METIIFAFAGGMLFGGFIASAIVFISLAKKQFR